MSDLPRTLLRMMYIWDNGEEFSDHAVWFIETDLDPDAIEGLLNAAVNPFSRRGGVVAVLDENAPIAWRQNRIESFEAWFTYHGDNLINWRTRTIPDAMRKLPKDAMKRLATRLSPANAAIVEERMKLD